MLNRATRNNAEYEPINHYSDLATESCVILVGVIRCGIQRKSCSKLQRLRALQTHVDGDVLQRC